MKNKGSKPSQPASTTSGDKGPKSKSNKTNKNCNYCKKDGHLESKWFKNMEALEATMKKHNTNLSSSSSASSHGHALSSSSFFFNNATSTSSNEWIIDYGASYHMVKDKAIFSSLNDCNIKQISIDDDRSLNVVGSIKFQVDNGHFNDVLHVPILSCNLLLVYQLTHSCEGKIVEFSPH